MSAAQRKGTLIVTSVFSEMTSQSGAHIPAQFTRRNNVVFKQVANPGINLYASPHNLGKFNQRNFIWADELIASIFFILRCHQDFIIQRDWLTSVDIAWIH